MLLVIIGSNIIRKLGWYTAAMITPIVLFTTGMIFFLMINFEVFTDFIGYITALNDPLILMVYAGMIQNIFSKSSKYTLFDSTKEMSYVPLGKEIKTKGKAAADVLGTKLGKSTSALLQSAIFIIFPNTDYISISASLMVIFCVICLIWMWTIRQLSYEYNKLTLKKHLNKQGVHK